SVGHSGDSDQSRTSWMLGPGDDPFLTQTLQVHFVELLPGGANHGHGHQNEACFYILEGKGYEIHDGVRYDWEKDDFAIVHTDCVHKHFNANEDVRALALVMKAKTNWMAMGLWQQGRSGPFDATGKGHSLHWDVEAEIADKYYARVAETPSRWDFTAGDLVYVPQNTVHQHINDGDEPLLFISAQNRLFKQLGYDNVAYLEDAVAGK